MNFDNFQLNPGILQGLKDAGYVQCTPVQQESLEASLTRGRDIYAQSQTGTGKTAAFLVPVLHLLSNGSDASKRGFGLILVPTRELATQVEKEAKLLGKYLSLKIAQIFGGVDYARQERVLAKRPDLIIATPGRLTDFVNKGVIGLQNVKFLVIDEADRMFDMGFQNDILALIRKMPSPENRRTFLFSATLSAKVGSLVWEHMRDPVTIAIEPDRVTVNAIEQQIYHVARKEKFSLLFSLIQRYKPRNLIVFSNTKIGAARIAYFFKKLNMRCGILEGNMPQSKRSRVVNDLVSGNLSFLAATDVASRGLHVPNLDWVINFDLPNEPENYVHRIGRTARAGCAGKAINFACERYVFNLSAIESLIGKKIPVAWPDQELQDLMTSFGKQIRLLEIQRRSEDPEQGSFSHKGNSRPGFDSGTTRGKFVPKTFQRTIARPSEKVRGSDKFLKPYDSVGRKRTSSVSSVFENKPVLEKMSQQRQRIQHPKKIEDRLAYYAEKYGEQFQSLPMSQERESGTSGGSDKVKTDKTKLFGTLYSKIFGNHK